MSRSKKQNSTGKSVKKALDDPLPVGGRRPVKKQKRTQRTMKRLGLRMLGDALHLSEGARADSGDLFFEEIPMTSAGGVIKKRTNGGIPTQSRKKAR